MDEERKDAGDEEKDEDAADIAGNLDDRAAKEANELGMMYVDASVHRMGISVSSGSKWVCMFAIEGGVSITSVKRETGTHLSHYGLGIRKKGGRAIYSKE